jgi:hypothetical protein
VAVAPLKATEHLRLTVEIRYFLQQPLLAAAAEAFGIKVDRVTHLEDLAAAAAVQAKTAHDL